MPAKDFATGLRSLPQSERLAAITTHLTAFADSKGWTRAPKIEKMNPGRTIYKDKDFYYSIDKKHGTFEKTTDKGKHLGELDSQGNMLPGSIDKSGGHDLKT
ncbi:colicin E3/pyocin S6 family cytotoxin [Mesorhizobium huakuii]|uniref:Colicin E3/pyocin S6 family cytotoxin n=1 Tax=Mesorhizobium huakuii TaxID=28104 RepID=A0ABZ0VK78_9HYPH|nr:colicin E3/pyocin S6 family cytotoxin [Mesorhizobium huakuii]WQB97383.1 colicin E3/pyocin S6 family cytotoxin [Mesorhizobium huakuii]